MPGGRKKRTEVCAIYIKNTEDRLTDSVAGERMGSMWKSQTPGKFIIQWNYQRE